MPFGHLPPLLVGGLLCSVVSFSSLENTHKENSYYTKIRRGSVGAGGGTVECTSASWALRQLMMALQWPMSTALRDAEPQTAAASPHRAGIEATRYGHGASVGGFPGTHGIKKQYATLETSVDRSSFSGSFVVNQCVSVFGNGPGESRGRDEWGSCNEASSLYSSLLASPNTSCSIVQLVFVSVVRCLRACAVSHAMSLPTHKKRRGAARRKHEMEAGGGRQKRVHRNCADAISTCGGLVGGNCSVEHANHSTNNGKWNRVLLFAKLSRATIAHARYLSWSTRKEVKHTSIESSLQPASLLGLLLLDSEIERFALVPLPNNHPLFCEALTKADDALDESDLGHWKAEPLFVEDDDTFAPHSDWYLHFTQSLAIVLHSVQLHDNNQRDGKHHNELKTNGKAVIAALRGEIIDLLSGWEQVGLSGLIIMHITTPGSTVCIKIPFSGSHVQFTA
ncbi:hypothetical protein B0H17DRAFT_1141898 [Mycena rosella]|uniref:Uncharacterized protein n=1 Tax=Mycena rosella TaxID=1033263 RepID=A0AAD7CYU0_MYCRO|nr:hypothetical protein B0H17DRAFT_1141898 [Mycena rosella]